MKMRLLIAVLAMATTLVGVARAADQEDEKTFYFLGTAIYESLQPLGLTEKEADLVIKGLKDSIAGKAESLDANVYNQKLRLLSEQRMAEAGERERELGAAYLAKMAKEKGAVKTDSGLVYLEQKKGDGARPTSTSVVKAHYTGTLRDGTVFDSSIPRGEPLQIGLNQVIPCWTEGIAMMQVGGQAKLTCPSDIAYGERSQGLIPPNAVLTFEVELLEVVQ